MTIRKKGKEKSVYDVVKRNFLKDGLKEEEFFGTDMFPHIKNLKEAKDFILEWIKTNPAGNITVVGDYDSDGINATAILYWCLHWLTAKTDIKIKLRIPKRFTEGYGLKETIINEIDDGLLITVDNGIAAHPAIKAAKEKGLDVIITDHHLPVRNTDGEVVLPEADIIVDPAAETESDFHDYCGAALAFRLAKELLPDKLLRDLHILAALATVTDIMPLYGANRLLVKEGLELINNNKSIAGLKELLKSLEKNGKLTKDSFDKYHLTEEDFGFLIGPTFNASGRLFDTGANQVIKLLTAEADNPRISWRADKLYINNEKRKEVVKYDMERVNSYLPNERPIVLYDSEIGEGIIGLIAGRLCEEHNCPVIVFTETEQEGVIKGSGRSPKGIHLKYTLDKIQEYIIGYGGHAGAAGLSIKLKNLEKFKEAFIAACGEMPEKTTEILYDLELKEADIESTSEQLKKYAPYGEGNPKILFHYVYKPKNKWERIGEDKSHFMVRDENITLIGFGLAEKYEKAGEPETLDMVGYLSESWYGNKKNYKFDIKEFV